MRRLRDSLRVMWRRVTEAIWGLGGIVVWFVTRREGVELAIGVVLILVGIPVWTRASAELGIGLVVGGGIACAHALVTFVLEQRRRATEARDAFERELAEIHRIAQLARAVLLEVELWRDVDAMPAHTDGQWANPGREIPPPPSWTAAAILARGRGALEPVKVRGWSTIAQQLRDHAEHLTHLIDQEFPGQPAERRAELRSVFRASEKSAEGADAIAAARGRVVELAPGTPAEDRHRAEDALKDAADFFFGALQWVEGTIEQMEHAEEMRREIEEAT